MKLVIRARNVLNRRAMSKKKLVALVEEPETETTSRSTTCSDDVASVLSSSVKSLPKFRECHKNPPARKAPSREPSLEIGEGYGGLARVLEKYHSIVDSTSSLACDSGEALAGRDATPKTKETTAALSTSKYSGKKSHDILSKRTESVLSHDSPAGRGIQRHGPASATSKIRKQQLRRVPSNIGLQDFFQEYDEITSTGGAKSVTGW